MRASRDSVPGRGRAFLVIVIVMVVAGVVVGLVWTRLNPHVAMTMTELGPFPNTELEAARQVSMDAWYAALGAVTGLLLGAVLATVYLRHGVLTVVALLVGAVLASVLAFVTGSLVANGAVVVGWHPQAAPGSPLTAPLNLHAYGVLLSWPIGALAPVVPLVWLGWSRDEE